MLGSVGFKFGLGGEPCWKGRQGLKTVIFYILILFLLLIPVSLIAEIEGAFTANIELNSLSIIDLSYNQEA